MRLRAHGDLYVLHHPIILISFPNGRAPPLFTTAAAGMYYLNGFKLKLLSTAAHAVLLLMLDIHPHRVCSAGRHPPSALGGRGGFTRGRKREGYPLLRGDRRGAVQ